MPCLQGVTLSGHTAAGALVYAAERSSLTLTNCSITANSQLAVNSTRFDSSAASAAGAAPTGGWDYTRSAGGAIRLLGKEPGPLGDSMAATAGKAPALLVNNTLDADSGMSWQGSALYMGPASAVILQVREPGWHMDVRMPSGCGQIRMLCQWAGSRGVARSGCITK
jgi:hypothetical protein